LHLSWAVFAPVLKIFGILAVGLLYGKLSDIDSRPIADLTMQLFVPCLAFSSIMSHEIELADFQSMVGSSVLSIAGTAALAALTFRIAGMSGRGLYMPVMFLNAANLPFPLVEDIYGEAGLFRGVLYYTATSALLFSVGLYMVARKADWRELLRVPALPAVALALGLNFGGARPPAALMEAVDLVGRAAIPLVLFVLGHTLCSVKISHLKTTVVLSALRIGGGLLTGVLAVKLFSLEGINREVVLLYSIMPSAVVNVIMCKKYDADAETVASTVFLTTAASLVTIPLMLAYLGP